ncbi:hypothetical protein BGX24_000850, partial [Mortierella sp. AD032]
WGYTIRTSTSSTSRIGTIQKQRCGIWNLLVQGHRLRWRCCHVRRYLCHSPL